MANEPPSDGPPGFTWEQWNDPAFGFAASAVLASAMLWHIQHRHDWQDPDDDESYEAALHAACVLLNRHIQL